MEGFYRQKGVGGTRKLIDYFKQDRLPLGEGRRPYPQMTSLVLTRKFQTRWFKILLLREAKTTVN